MESDLFQDVWNADFKALAKKYADSGWDSVNRQRYEAILGARVAAAQVAATDASARTARWTKYMAIATALLAGMTAVFSVLTWAEDEPRLPPVVLKVAFQPGEDSSGAAANRRAHRACRYADLIELYRSDGTFAGVLECDRL